MALIEYDIFGTKYDKVGDAINRLKAFEPEEGYYVAFSGGKDSVCVKALCDMAGVKYDAHYNATTVDPPELVRFIIHQYPDVEIVKPRLPMRKLIVEKQIPPTRLQRYCCEELKEVHGEGRLTVTGVRWDESKNRKDNQGAVTIVGHGKAARKEVGNAIDATGANFTETLRGGVVLNYDDAATRRMVEMCYRTHKTLINPIIDWTDEDVWEFIRTYNIPYCSLYDEGWKRLGCIGCPLGGFASQKREFKRWPVYRKLYISAFEEMLKARIASGKNDQNNLWKDGEGVFKWWTGEAKNGDKNQMSMFDEME